MCEDNMLFSQVKISVLGQKLTWYFIGIYIILINLYFSFHINNKNNLPKPENPIRTSIESEVSLSFLKSALKKKKQQTTITTVLLLKFGHLAISSELSNLMY